jgi:hypothetical protein
MDIVRRVQPVQLPRLNRTKPGSLAIRHVRHEVVANVQDTLCHEALGIQNVVEEFAVVFSEVLRTVVGRGIDLIDLDPRPAQKAINLGGGQVDVRNRDDAFPG